MKKTDPAKHYYLRLAMHSYGKALNRPQKPNTEAKPSTSEQEPTFELAAPLCETFHLPVGTQVSLREFVDLTAKASVEKVSVEPITA
jgi:hypothetical protein